MGRVDVCGQPFYGEGYTFVKGKDDVLRKGKAVCHSHTDVCFVCGLCVCVRARSLSHTTNG